MSGAWLQDALVAVIVLAAAGFLAWTRVRARRRPTPYCGDCPGCESGPAAPDRSPIVTIGEPGERGR